MKKKLTKEQIWKKYKDKYVEVIQTYDYTNQRRLYEIVKVYKELRENTTL
jgi:hypothetical protein